MAIVRMDNVGIVVDDLDAAVEFFTVLGMELEGRQSIEGEWAEHVVGLRGMRSEIAMMGIPGASGKLELATYHAPELLGGEPAIPNTLGFHRVMFAVDDLDETIARLRPLGGEVLDEVVDYGGVVRLCYFRGPGGIVLGLAEDS
ncbi:MULTISPECIES: VOC family protein [unclassified Microbacterium]|uniref:VOC family protein n=1 Tax=unclassified Microbacterium TaxID=2609290 RepID=UPI0018E022F7|nr:VOC family protein [Microbacterium sp. MAH-37]